LTRRIPLPGRVQPAAVVGLIVVLGTLLSWRHTRNAHEWLIMTDELQYLKLAQSVGDGAFPWPTVRGEHGALLSLLYPLLIGPVVALFSAPDGYQLIHLVNALLFASTAVPVYLLTRQVVAARWPAYLAAALAVAVPWASLSAVVMTESAAYPAFAWALLAIQRALVAPSPGRDLVALAAIGLAFFARTQFVFLAGVFPLTVVLHSVLYTLVSGAPDAGRSRLRQLLDALRPHAALGALAALAVVLLLLPSDPLKNLLGPFQNSVFQGGRLPDGLGHAARTHLAYVAGGVGILPLALAAGWSLASLVRPLDRASQAFASLALVAGGALLYVVTVFGLLHSGGPLDRYLFYLAPLLIVATVACLAQGRARPLGLAVGAVFAFWLLRTSGVRFLDDPTLFVNSQATEFHRVFQGQADRVARLSGIGGLSPIVLMTWGTLAATAAVSLLLWRAPRLALAIVGLPLLGLALAQTDYVSKRFTLHINTASGNINPGTIGGRDWVDEALTGPGDVAISPTTVADAGASRLAWWNVEFWNKRVNRAVLLEGFGDHTPFAQRGMTLDKRDGTISTSDGYQPRFMVFGRNQIIFRPRGRLLAEYRTTLQQDPGLELFELERPYRPGWIAEGASADGWVVRGTPAVVRVFPRADGRAQRLTVNVDLPVGLVKPSPFALRTGPRVVRGRAAPGTINGDAQLALCLPPGRLREASLSTGAVRPLPDGRKVGIHLYSIRVEPAPAAGC
jgi:hypothetical protein